MDLGGDLDDADDAATPEKAAARRSPPPSSIGLTVLVPSDAVTMRARVGCGRLSSGAGGVGAAADTAWGRERCVGGWGGGPLAATELWEPERQVWMARAKLAFDDWTGAERLL
ncbi:MAG: hypothetical protein HUU17_13940, partial [Chthonomonadales bacterium]|nr:hypothetical protein [Chthonomonadales bacterium]